MKQNATRYIFLCYTTLFLQLVSNGQTILNGDFETNSGNCLTNIPNATYDANMANSIGFGVASQLDIMDNACGFGAAESGSWFVGMAIDINGHSDALSLQLSAPLVIGGIYQLSYYDRKDPGYATNPVIIGISDTDSIFGTQIFLSPIPVLGWTQHVITFTANIAANYITIQASGNVYSWTHVDNFSFLGSNVPLQISVNPVFATCDNVCNGSAVVTASGGTPPYHYQWQGSGDTTSSIDSLCAASTNIVTVTDSTGASVSDTFFLPAVDPFPIILAVDSPVICSGQTTQICAPAGYSVYTWNTGDTTMCITASSNQSYSVTATESDGCTAHSNPVSITVNAAPLVSITATDTAICNGQNDTLTASATGATGYLWSTGSTNAMIVVSVSNTYRVLVTNGTCSASDSINVTIHSAPQVMVQSNRDSICSIDTAQICATGGFASYTWNTGQTTSCILTQSAGGYFVTVSDNIGCTAMSNQVSLHVFQSPTVSISRDGDTLRVYNATNIQWYYNGSVINGADSDIYIAIQPGEYQVQVTDSNGCSARSSLQNISAINSPPDELYLLIFPNPSFNGKWVMVADDKLIGNPFEIFDAEGRTVYKARMASGNNLINLSISDGIYVLFVSTPQGAIIRKLIKLKD